MSEASELRPDAPSRAPAATPSFRSVCIASHGKSGSKRLLFALDLSARTFCRNEPYNVAGTPWRDLWAAPQRWAMTPAEEERLARLWSRAIDWASLRRGPPDLRLAARKDYLRRYARPGGLVALVESRRIRGVLSRVLPGLDDREWRLSGWLARPSRLASAMLVLKINQAPALMTWVLAQRPDNLVVHLLRHPAAVLYSWRHRLLARTDEREVCRASRDRLMAIARVSPRWSRAFGDIESMSVEMAELWFWRYMNETIYEQGQGTSRYFAVRDEDLASEPVETARALYRACQLGFTPEIAERLARQAGQWRSMLTCWRELTPSREQATIRSILEGSPLQHFWDENQLVSGFEYTSR